MSEEVIIHIKTYSENKIFKGVLSDEIKEILIQKL